MALSPTFRALENRNYRLFAAGGVISNVGTWMGRVAQDWLVLTSLTDYSSLALGAVALVPCGLTALTAMTTANALVQLSVDPAMRGRVMALYMAIFWGGTPLGAPLVGWLGDVAGPAGASGWHLSPSV